MSYSASDFADNVCGLLRDLGYSFDEDDNGHFWQFGTEKSVSWISSDRYEEGNQAVEAAMRDFLERTNDLRISAAGVIGSWEHGDLAGAVASLQMDLDACLPGPITDFIKEHG